MKIAISGATGFIGTHLTRYLSGQGHEVTGLGRKWFGRGNADHLAKLMEGMDVVINLAGAPVNHRWTTAYKQELYDSRIIPTRMLVDAINRTVRVRLFISASAVGYYPSRGCYDEYSHVKSDGFWPDCVGLGKQSWTVRKSARLIITRFGWYYPLRWGFSATYPSFADDWQR
ncbi:MAG: NAD-dependent epimerase/dehydratase family protein [Odoribacter splanchnicus]